MGGAGMTDEGAGSCLCRNDGGGAQEWRRRARVPACAGMTEKGRRSGGRGRGFLAYAGMTDEGRRNGGGGRGFLPGQVLVYAGMTEKEQG